MFLFFVVYAENSRGRVLRSKNDTYSPVVQELRQITKARTHFKHSQSRAPPVHEKLLLGLSCMCY